MCSSQPIYTSGLFEACYCSYIWSKTPGIYQGDNIQDRNISGAQYSRDTCICPATQIGQYGPTPHFILYGWFWCHPIKMPAVSSISVPAVLTGYWGIINLHFQSRCANQIYFSQEAPPGKGPDLQEVAPELISRVWGLPPFLLVLLQEGAWGRRSYQNRPVGFDGLVTQLGLTSAITINLPELLLSWPLLDHYLSFRRLSGLVLVSGFSDQFYHIFRIFSFLKEKKVELEIERKKN